MNSNTLSDKQCDQFRRLPASFNDMVRAIFLVGRAYGKGHKIKDDLDAGVLSVYDIIEYLERVGFDVRAGYLKR